MSLRSRLPFVGTSASASHQDEPKAIQIDEALAKNLRERAIAAGPVLKITPYNSQRDTDADRSFFRDVHTVRRGGPNREQNHSTPFAFEPYYDPDAGTIGFRYIGQDERTRVELRQGLEAAYHDSDLNREPPEFVDAEAGQYVSVARLTLRDPEALKPINNPGLNARDFDPDPYDSITRRMTGTNSRENASVVTQIVYMPAISHAGADKDANSKLNWHYGAESVAKDLRQARLSIRWEALPEMLLDTVTEGTDEIEVLNESGATNKEGTAATQVENQINQKGYHANIRIVAVADDPEVAKQRVAATAEKYRNFYNSTTGQGLRPVFDVDVAELAKKAARRSWVDRGMPMSLDESLALGAPPTKLSTPEVSYTHRSSDQGMPADSPTFGEYDETGYSDEWVGGGEP